MYSEEVVRALHEIIKVLEKGWTTNVMARTKKGHICGPRDPNADSWCPLGAAEKVLPANSYIYYQVLGVITVFVNRNISMWNDQEAKNKSEVILAFSMAIIAYKERLL